MRLKRTATVKERVNQLLSKNEPSFTAGVEVVKLDMALALNWYAQHKDKKTAQKYLVEYCKRHNIKATEAQIGAQVPTLGFVCRMVERGAKLDAQGISWFTKRLNELTHYIPKDALFTDIKENTKVATPTKIVTIQDRLREKSSRCIGELEGAIDEFILSDFKKTPNTLEIMRRHDLKGVHGPNIVNFFKKWRDEFRVAITGKDPQLNEAYGNYTLTQMKKMEELYDQIISDALKIMGEALSTRAPRTKKPRAPEKQIKNLKFCAEDKVLNLKSIPPIRVVGAQNVWVYNRKTRVLHCYMADDAMGLQIKGASFFNFSVQKSWGKKLRKPDEILPQVVAGGKVFLRNLHEQLTTKNVKVTGRLNKETVLLRATI